MLSQNLVYQQSINLDKYIYRYNNDPFNLSWIIMESLSVRMIILKKVQFKKTYFSDY